ncbi:MAG: hypothetical protein PHE54_03565 [Bacilli bacterium]|nr:hypothetical protein [Bacilli bacterium]
MKKLNIIFSLIIIILTIFTACFLYDFYQKDIYYPYYGKKNIQLLNIPSDSNISSEDFISVMDRASNNSVILEKTTTDSEGSILIHYVSLEKLNLLKYILKTRDYSRSEKCVSTIQKSIDDQNCILISDFLNNDKHTYMLMNDYIITGNSLSGQYNAYYDNQDDLNDFYNSVSEILDIDVTTNTNNTFSTSENSTEFIILCYIIIVGILLMMLLFFNIFGVYKDSRIIGIYKLNGFSDFRVFRKMVKKYFLLLIGLSLISFIISLLIIKNIDIFFIIILFVALAFISILQILIYYLSVFIISRKIKLFDLIKNVSLTETIIKANMLFKTIALGIIIIGVLLSLIQFNNYNQRKKILSDFNDYANYAVFGEFYMAGDSESFLGNSDEMDEAELQLYQFLNNYDIIYADFRAYKTMTEKEVFAFSQPTQNGNKRYKYAKVDYNYVNKIGIKDNVTHQNITLDKDMGYTLILIPEKYEAELENIKLYYYEYHEKKDTDQFIIYENDKMPTLNPNVVENSEYKIDCPIMKVISPNNVSLRLISVFGSGYETPLKINLENYEDENTFYNEIAFKLVELKLDDNLKADVFYTIGEIFNVELLKLSQQIIGITILIVMFLILYLNIIFQNVMLFFQSQFKKIAVYKLHGYSDYKILKSTVNMNLIFDSLVLLAIFIAFYKYFTILTFVFIYITVCSFDYILYNIIIKYKLKNFVSNAIKGGEL